VKEVFLWIHPAGEAAGEAAVEPPLQANAVQR